MLLKMLSSFWLCFTRRKRKYLRTKGCPVSVAENVNYISSTAGLPNPNLDPRLVVPLNIAYWRMRIGRMWNRIKAIFSGGRIN
jgi:hypothetical protein